MGNTYADISSLDLLSGAQNKYRTSKQIKWWIRTIKVKIIDIGLSTQDKPEQMLNLYYGANTFDAPELFLGYTYNVPKNHI